MKTQARIALASAFVPLLIAACSQPSAPPAAATADASGAVPQTALGRMAANAIGEARVKLAKENINLNGEFISNDGHHNVIARVGRKNPSDTRPDAELTPGGDLLIDGKQVPVDASQHAMLLRYRQTLMGVAETGMQLGVQGADLGGQAIGEVFKDLMSGHPDQIDKNINAKAGKIEAQAMQLCKQLQPVQAMQQQLAAAVPQFAPYATLKASDIEDCGKHHAGSKVTVSALDDSDRAELKADVGNEVRERVRAAVQPGTPAPATQDGKAPSASAH